MEAHWRLLEPLRILRAIALPLDKVMGSDRSSAIAAPVRCDKSIKVLDVVAGGRTNLDDGQLTPGHKTFNRRPGHAEVVGSGADRQQALVPPLWLEFFLVLPRFLPFFACG